MVRPGRCTRWLEALIKSGTAVSSGGVQISHEQKREPWHQMRCRFTAEALQQPLAPPRPWRQAVPPGCFRLSRRKDEWLAAGKARSHKKQDPMPSVLSITAIALSKRQDRWCTGASTTRNRGLPLYSVLVHQCWRPFPGLLLRQLALGSFHLPTVLEIAYAL